MLYFTYAVYLLADLGKILGAVGFEIAGLRFYKKCSSAYPADGSIDGAGAATDQGYTVR